MSTGLATTTVFVPAILGSADPHWTAYLTALGTPIVALIAAGVAAYIAHGNWQTARDKLKADLFDRRVLIYKGVRKIFFNLTTVGKLQSSDELELMELQSSAMWLFDTPVGYYLEKTLIPEVRELVAKDEEYSYIPVSNEYTDRNPEYRMTLIAQRSKLRESILGRRNEVDALFKPHLQLKH